MSDAIDTKDTKEAGDMLPAMTADEKMIQDGFNELLKDYLNSNPGGRWSALLRRSTLPIRRMPA